MLLSPPPACRPDLISGWLFGVCLFLLFFIFLLILTVGRSKSIGGPLQPLLAQRLLGLQAGLLKACLLPIAQAWAAVRAGGPCREWGWGSGGGHIETLKSWGGAMPNVCGGDWGKVKENSQGSGLGERAEVRSWMVFNPVIV